jgi:hypothetical protein
MPFGNDSAWIRAASAFVVAAVTSFGALAMFQIYAIRDQVGALTVEVDRVASVEELFERVVTLELKETQTPHAQLSSAKDQFPNFVGELVEMELVDGIHEIGFDPKRSRTHIKISEPGDYFVVAAPQVRRQPDFSGDACITFWLQLNGGDLANSSVKHCWSGGKWRETDVVVLQTMISLEAGDQLSVAMRSDPEFKSGIVAIAPSDIPLVPAIIFSILKVA